MADFEDFDLDDYNRRMRELQDRWIQEAAGRSREMRDEADRAGGIAERDERVVAGEDTERAAETAANLAKQQLGAASGGGAAAIAGMQAAQGARDKEYAGLLQSARLRKDQFEQKEVDRRRQAYYTFMDAVSAAQAVERDRQLREFYIWLNKNMKQLSEQGQSANTTGKTEADRDGERGQSIEYYRSLIHNAKTREELYSIWKRVPEAYKDYLNIDYTEATQRIDKGEPTMGPEHKISAVDLAKRQIEESQTLNELEDVWKNLDVTVQGQVIKQYQDKRTTLSDERLKLYNNQGNNAGDIGDPEESYKKNLAKAKENFDTEDLSGINKALGNRWG